MDEDKVGQRRTSYIRARIRPHPDTAGKRRQCDGFPPSAALCGSLRPLRFKKKRAECGHAEACSQTGRTAWVFILTQRSQRTAEGRRGSSPGLNLSLSSQRFEGLESSARNVNEQGGELSSLRSRPPAVEAPGLFFGGRLMDEGKAVGCPKKPGPHLPQERVCR